MIATLLRRAADFLDPPVEPEVCTTVGWLSPRNAIVTADECAFRNEVAASLIDDDTVGYVVFRVRRVDPLVADLQINAQVAREAWPDIASAMAQIVLRGDDAVRASR